MIARRLWSTEFQQATLRYYLFEVYFNINFHIYIYIEVLKSYTLFMKI